MTSIRRALTLRLLGVLGLVTAIVAVALFVGVRAALIAQFDATLRARLAALESASRWDGRTVDLDYVREATPWYQPGPDAEYFEIRALGDAGAMIARSPSLGDAALEFRAGEREIADARLPDGRPGRFAAQVFKPAPEEELDAPGREAERARAVASTPSVRITVAMSRGGLDATLRIFAVALMLASGIMALGLIVGVGLALRAGLSPLQRLSADVEQIRADTLSRRLDGDHLPDELRPIHARLNELIERLETAFARERRFASAAAHELRTPVAELRSLLEVSISRPRSAEAARQSLEEALDVTVRLQNLVAALLALSKPVTGPDPARRPTTPVVPLLRGLMRRFEPLARARGGGMVLAGDECRASAETAALESIFANVLANAVEYASPTPTIRCEVRADGRGRVCIDVMNPCQAVDPEELARFFEPFWRRGESRTGHEHLGLGLSVARAMAENCGGGIAAEQPSEKTIRIRITLPGVPASEDESARDSDPGATGEAEVLLDQTSHPV